MRKGIGSNREVLLFGWLVAIVTLMYAFDIGHGFVKDDFVWIATSRLSTTHDVVRLFTTAETGFYRPLVALSFGIDERLFGLQPMGYALTNLACLFVILIGISLLVRALGFTAMQGICAAALWALNFHGINMALLWISGRTALLLCACAVFAAAATERHRHVWAGALTFGAMLCKEEATMLPFILLGWLAVDLRAAGHLDLSPRLGRMFRGVAPCFFALVAYVALRSSTSAMTPGTAPSYYHLSAAPGMLISNIAEYADRSLTFQAIALLCLLAFSRRWPRLTATERDSVARGTIWLVGGFAITLFVPVRSSLYVCLPLIGSVLVTIAVASAIWRDIPAPRRRRAIVAALLLPLVLLPVYRARNARLANEARLSARFMGFITAAVHRDPGITSIVCYDNPNERPSLKSAFGSLLPAAVELQTGRRLMVTLEEGPGENMLQAKREGASLHIRLLNGQPVLAYEQE